MAAQARNRSTLAEGIPPHIRALLRSGHGDGLVADSREAIAEFPFGLAKTGIHEIAEAAYGDFAPAMGFALAACRKLAGPILWVTQTRTVLEHGRLYHTGLSGFYEHQPIVLTVETRKQTDALWAIEEAITSKAVGLVLAEIDQADFTASRRLSLASERHGVPAILLMPYTKEGASAAQARWRVSASPSAPNRFDAHGLGRPRWRVVLERSRLVPHLAGHTFDVEFSDETFSLNLVSELADHATSPRPAGLDSSHPANPLRRTG